MNARSVASGVNEKENVNPIPSALAVFPTNYRIYTSKNTTDPSNERLNMHAKNAKCS